MSGIRKDREAGAALLMALLTVALVATFAAASLWQQWRAIEVETSERVRIQSGWVLTGALDWARLLLREDLGSATINAVDHLGEPWAVPLQEARLSTFLSADRNNTSTDYGPEVMDAFLSGQIIDLHSVMNLNNLVLPNGQLAANETLEAFQRLFAILGLPDSEFQRLAEQMRFAVSAARAGQGPAQAPLRPRRVSELVWLGISPQTIAALEPYVTLFELTDSKINVNTASAEVIAAARGIDLADAQRMVQIREASFFRRVADFNAQLGSGAPAPPSGQGAQGQGYEIDVKSDFFEVRSRLRLDKLVVEERSVLHRAGNKVTIVSRERGTLDPTALSRIAMTQQR